MTIKKLIDFFYTFLWILPFIFFLTGYLTIRALLHKQIVYVPQLVGANMVDAIKALSAQKLNARILDQKEDSDMPEGTVINQSPKANVKLKVGQPVFLVITRAPAKNRAPSLYYNSLENAKEKLIQEGLSPKFYLIPSIAQQNLCFAQEVKPARELNSKVVIAYFSKGKTSLVIMPNLKGLGIEQVRNFLKKNNIDVVVHEDGEFNSKKKKNNTPFKVKKQRPMAGSLVDISKLKRIILVAK